MSRLDELKEQRATLLEKLKEDQILMENFRKSLKFTQDTLNSLNREIESLTPKPNKISDHAILRYLERFKECSPLIHEAKTELERLAKKCPKNCKWPLGNDKFLVVREGVVTTIM